MRCNSLFLIQPMFKPKPCIDYTAFVHEKSFLDVNVQKRLDSGPATDVSRESLFYANVV